MNRPARVPMVVAALVAAGAAQVEWTVVANSGPPPAYCGHAWDPARSRLVAFGGQLGAGILQSTTFEWNGSQWLIRAPSTAPTARARAAMVYDGARNVTVLFGGNVAGAGAASFSNQTWLWNGTNWSTPAVATVPPSRYGAALAYDSARQVVVMFGGFVPSGADAADVWEWNGSNWTQRVPASASPPARGAHRMVFDDAHGVCVMYGGYRTPLQATVADAWSWNGSSWTQLPGGPGSLCDQVFAYDAARRRVVLFGGLRIQSGSSTDLNQTWEWDGVSWAQRATAVVPSARSAGANGFDTVRGRVLLGGGTAGLNLQAPDTLALAPTRPGSTIVFGVGCPSSAGPIVHDMQGLPYLGSSMALRLSGAPTNASVGFMIIGKSNRSWSGVALPLDLGFLGAPSCPLNVSMDIQETLALSNGQGSYLLSLPNVSALLGMRFYTQAAAIDPQNPLPLPIALSPGRGFTVGSP